MLTKENFSFFPACSLLLEPAHFQFLSDFSSLLVYYILLENGILVKCTKLIMKFPSFIQFHCILVFLKENLQYQAKCDGLSSKIIKPVCLLIFEGQWKIPPCSIIRACSFPMISWKFLPARLLKPARLIGIQEYLFLSVRFQEW